MRALFAWLLMIVSAMPASARELHIATQYGLAFLPLMVMEHEHLFDKRLAEAGFGDTTVSWSTLGGGSAVNEAMLAGNVNFASGGVGLSSPSGPRRRRSGRFAASARWQPCPCRS